MLRSGDSSSLDRFRSDVRERASREGVELSAQTVDELSSHLDDIYRDALGDGLNVVDARQRSLAALEGPGLALLRQQLLQSSERLQTHQLEDQARWSSKRGLDVMTPFRMAFRQLRHHPATALITVVVLGLGVAAATVIYTIVDTVVLKPLPYEEPDRLVTIWDTNVSDGRFHDPLSPVNFSDQRELDVFEDAAAWWRPGINLIDPGLDPVRVNTIEVSGNLFDLLGVRPLVGAGFPEGGPLFAPNDLIVVISERLWQRRYSGDPAVIGKQLSLNDTPYTVVGVMPKGFHYPDDVDIWERLRWDMTQHDRQAHFMEAVARLAPDTTIERAQSAVDALWTVLERETAESRNTTGVGWGSRLIPLLDEQLGYYRPALFVLFGAVGLLLAAGVLNIGTLLLTRALSREREVAVRIAMGASPGQLVAQLLAESCLLSVAGAAFGVAAAAVCLPLLVSFTPVEIPRLSEARLSFQSFGMGIGIATLTTLFFGLVPALLLLRKRLTTDLKSGERGSSSGARRIYSVLVVSELALACALLTSSALLVRTVRQMVQTPTGVDAAGVLTTSVQLASDAYDEWTVVSETHSRLIEHIREQPGVDAVGGSNALPFVVAWRGPFAVAGMDASRVEDLPQAQMVSASEGYFESMGAKLASGRLFSTFDSADSPGVLVVNESFVRQYMGDIEPIGGSVTTYASGIGPLGRNLLGPRGPYSMEIVGVVKDVRNAPLGQPTEAAFYFTTRQFPFRELFLTVRAADTSVALSAVRSGLNAVAPNVPMAASRTWDERSSERTAEPRLLMTVLLFFGALSALLAALGVYGLFSWSVALRRRELAIRLTLGAQPARVGALVIRQSTLLVGVGLVVGLIIVRLAESVLARVLFEVSPGDMRSTLSAAALLVVAALVACAPPALRAMRVDPVDGLRSE